MLNAGLIFFFFLELISTTIFSVNVAAVETMDITKILTLQGGEAVYPLPRIKNLAVHPKLNLAAVIFAVGRLCLWTKHMSLMPKFSEIFTS
jgi:hypothetical protein